MKISIIVPVYNVERYIYRCISSLFAQTYQDIEFIFVDDATPDNSIMIIENYIKKLDPSKRKNVKFVRHNKNCGLSVARNSGIKVSTGEYILFIDSDDEITKDCIEKLTSPIIANKKKYDICCADYETIGGTVDCFLRIYGEVLEIDKSFYKNLWYAMAQNKLYKSDFLKKNNIFFKEGIIHEDELFSFKVASLAQSMFVIPDITYKYYINPNSITTSLSQEKHFLCWAIIVCEMAKFAEEYNKNNDYDLFNYVEMLKSNFSAEAYRYLSKDSFKTYYMLLAKYNWSPIKYYFKGFLYWKRFLKDLSFVLPKRLGYMYLCLWYKLTLK